MNKHNERMTPRILIRPAIYRSNIEFVLPQYADPQNLTSGFLIPFFSKTAVTERSRAGTKL